MRRLMSFITARQSVDGPSLCRLARRFCQIVLACLILGPLELPAASQPARITVSGTDLVADGARIYLNGANTPWHWFNEFGSPGGTYGQYDATWWTAEFGRLREAGINSTRIWISCNGIVQPTIDENGYVTGVSARFWQDVDHLMELARTHRIYVMATMMSFDHGNQWIWDNATGTFSVIPKRWWKMFSTPDRTQAMIDNYLLPFVNRYKDNPYLFAIDLCNEIEWMNQDSTYGAIPWSQLQRYVAMSAAAIHASGSQVLVTVGSASVKWHSAKYEGNYWSDANLQAQHASPLARLDFYQYHWYAWMEPWYPLLCSAADHQMTDRPLIIGELPAQDSGLRPSGTTMRQALDFFYAHGHSGHYPWTSNGVDSNGSLATFGTAAHDFQQADQSVVRTASTLQMIVFPSPPTVNWSTDPHILILTATAGSGLPVTFSILNGPGVISGNQLTILEPGTFVISASQGGNSFYAPAEPVTGTITVINPVIRRVTIKSPLRAGWILLEPQDAMVKFPIYEARSHQQFVLMLTMPPLILMGNG